MAEAQATSGIHSNTYLHALPDPADIRDRFNYALETWTRRNEFIGRVRTHFDGRNALPVPTTDTQITFRQVHTFLLQTVANEKAARFTLLPKLQVIPSGPSAGARAASTELEAALNAIQYWMERRGDGDVWSRVCLDAILFDIGVERIEAAPAAFWPELAVFEQEGQKRELLYSRFLKENSGPEATLSLPYEDTPDGYIRFRQRYKDFRESYKREAGAPLRALYVRPEFFLPHYEGTTLVWSFETELRGLNEVLRSKLFDPDPLAELSSFGAKLTDRQKMHQKVAIIHYVNSRIHAYYALAPTRQNPVRGGASGDAYVWPTGLTSDLQNIGKPILLHWYPHNLGESLYNVAGGRYGGWRDGQESHEIEGVMNALCELTQSTDELASQFATDVYNTYWPTMIEELDPNLRAADQSGGRPKSATGGRITPGQSIALWKGESIRPLQTAQPNPTAQWFFARLVEQIEKLSGSAAIYGQQEPGVRTGYHAYLQISQSEHLDEKLEARLSQGAINRGLKILRHIRAMNEEIQIFHRTRTRTGHQTGKYIIVSPKDLNVLPELDAAVRKPRPIDFDTALRAAQVASQDRAGPGTPLLDDDTIRERILGEDAPDLIEQRIIIQNEKRKLHESGVISELIGRRVGTILSQRQRLRVSDETAAMADPELLNAVGQMAPNAEGGLSPEMALAVQAGGMANATNPFAPVEEGSPVPEPNPPPAGIPAPSPLNGQGGGPRPMQPQAAQNAARAIRVAQQTQI